MIGPASKMVNRFVIVALVLSAYASVTVKASDVTTNSLCPNCGSYWAELYSWGYEYNSWEHWLVEYWYCDNCGSFQIPWSPEPHNLTTSGRWVSDGSAGCHWEYDEQCSTCGYSYHYQGDPSPHSGSVTNSYWVSDGEQGCHQVEDRICSYCGDLYQDIGSTQSHVDTITGTSWVSDGDVGCHPETTHQCSHCSYTWSTIGPAQDHDLVAYDSHHKRCSRCGHTQYFNTAPTGTVNGPSLRAGQYTNNPTQTISWIYTDAESDPQASWTLSYSSNTENGTVSGTTETSASFTLPHDGTWSWQLNVKDSEGAWATIGTGALVLDTVPPNPTGSGQYLGNGVDRITITSNEPVAYIRVAGSESTSQLATFDVTLEHGLDRTLSIVVADLAGNEWSCTGTYDYYPTIEFSGSEEVTHEIVGGDTNAVMPLDSVAPMGTYTLTTITYKLAAMGNPGTAGFGQLEMRFQFQWNGEVVYPGEPGVDGSAVIGGQWVDIQTGKEIFSKDMAQIWVRATFVIGLDFNVGIFGADHNFGQWIHTRGYWVYANGKSAPIHDS